MALFNGKEYVTVNTDAGFKEGIVTYGIWISSGKGRFKYFGKAKNKYHDSTQAELIAICTAIKQLQDKHLNILEKCDILVFNTDSKNAISVLKGDNKNSKYIQFHKYFHEIMYKIQDRYKFSFYLRWVKGHTKGNDKRTFVNNWCDRMSREMRKQG